MGLRKPFAYLRGDLWEEMGIRKKQLHWQQRSLTQRASRAGCRIKPLGTASPATNASVSRPCFACLLPGYKAHRDFGSRSGAIRRKDRYAPFARASCGASPPHRAQSLPLARSTRAPPLSGCSLSFTGLVSPPRTNAGGTRRALGEEPGGIGASGNFLRTRRYLRKEDFSTLLRA